MSSRYNLISYSLFGEKSKIYQVCVPYIVIANNIAYPDFKQRFHLSKELIDTPCYDFLKQLSSQNENIQIKEMTSNYKGIKPMLWRVLPWWDENIKYLLCRDIDSSITKLEIRAVRFFMSTGLKIHTIRSHKWHTTPLMGGLCAFYCPWISKQPWFPAQFKDFIKKSMLILKEYKAWEIGSDQEALKRFIYNDNKYKNVNERQTLDTFMQGAPSKLADHNPRIYSLKKYKSTDISYIDKYNELFKISDRIHSFVASPFKKIKRSHLKELLGLDCINTELSQQVRDILSQDKINKFYRVF